MSEVLYPSEALIIDDKRPIRVILFPGERGKQHNLSVGIWSLSRFELAQSEMDAAKYLQEFCKIPDAQLATGTALAEEEIKVQILWRALRDPKEPTRQFFKETTHLRTRLYADEITALYGAYLDFVDERSPIRRIRSSEEMDQVIDSLGKGSAAELSLNFFDSASLRSILLELAARHVKLMRQNFFCSCGQNATKIDSSDPNLAGK